MTLSPSSRSFGFPLVGSCALVGQEHGHPAVRFARDEQQAWLQVEPLMRRAAPAPRIQLSRYGGVTLSEQRAALEAAGYHLRHPQSHAVNHTVTYLASFAAEQWEQWSSARLTVWLEQRERSAEVRIDVLPSAQQLRLAVCGSEQQFLQRLACLLRRIPESRGCFTALSSYAGQLHRQAR
ncbi:hypothetical protein MF271_20100 (plasmid) [Deinococcus sp. KNUC1210]|uniref:hypothetical protein n=1 Tax=Deinococcus sp. KNUC1210 TaxID=2917691 RepID=UPI001EF00DE0|nr:hypothetical protein [Deinococcus sp. KNUC1210]ULH17713.1 hypothetical protein MF271_20100 [Deinococcus sp. KNUC1210]